jgi:hypothetical protein
MEVDDHEVVKSPIVLVMQNESNEPCTDTVCHSHYISLLCPATKKQSLPFFHTAEKRWQDCVSELYKMLEGSNERIKALEEQRDLKRKKIDE